MPTVTRMVVGWLTSPRGLWLPGASMDELLRFPVPAYLVETGAERILIDTGLHPAAVRDVAAHYGAPSPFVLEQDASVAEQLDLATLTRVVLTHLHFDHAGGLALLPPDLPIVLQRREWEAGQDADAVARNFLFPKDYAELERPVLVDGDHDLLGDGTIRLLWTPGHTPGHQSIVVGGRLVIGGDVTHFASTLEDHRFPVFADDHAAQARSADRLRALRDAGATVLPGHDPALLPPGPVLAART